MSNEMTNDRRSVASQARELESYEQRTPDQPDVQQIHGPIYREKAEPRDGHQPIPMWLLLPMFALLIWGGWYLGEHSGDFRANNYEGPAAFVNSPHAGSKQSKQPLDPMVVGRRVYNSCASCHQTDGQGVAGTYPPLKGAEWVTGDPRILARILLHGLQGPISVRGTNYSGAMPAWSSLSSEELAGVMTYIRNSWGNEAGEVSAELVADVRRSVGRRTSPWTQNELEQVKEQLADFESDAQTEEIRRRSIESRGGWKRRYRAMTCCDATLPTAGSSPAASARTSRGVSWVWLRIILAGFIAGNSMTWALAVNVSSATERERLLLHIGLLVATVAVGLLVGSRLLVDSLIALYRARLSIELLFLSGCLGALGISMWSMLQGSGPVYFEVISILLVIYRIGAELKASAKRRALRAADALSPVLNYCEVVQADGNTKTCLIESVRAGDDVRCHPGELIPIDGIIRDGHALVREAAVTGETFVVTKRPGDRGLRRYGPRRLDPLGSRQRSGQSAYGRPRATRRRDCPSEANTT